jgi:hypothetical protein
MNSRYGQVALEREVGALHGVTEGVRNESLNRAAFALGQLVGGGELEQGEAEDALEDAAFTIGLERLEARSTIRSGLRAGERSPRSAPEEERRQRRGRPRRPAPIPDDLKYALLGCRTLPFEWEAAKLLARLPEPHMRQDVLANWDYLSERGDIPFILTLARMLRGVAMYRYCTTRSVERGALDYAVQRLVHEDAR